MMHLSNDSEHWRPLTSGNSERQFLYSEKFLESQMAPLTFLFIELKRSLGNLACSVVGLRVGEFLFSYAPSLLAFRTLLIQAVVFKFLFGIWGLGLRTKRRPFPSCVNLTKNLVLITFQRVSVNLPKTVDTYGAYSRTHQLSPIKGNSI